MSESKNGKWASFTSDPHFMRLLKNGMSLLSASTIVSLLQFAQVVVLTRYLLPAGYGAFTLVVVYVALINQFIDVRVREMTVKYGAEFSELKENAKTGAVIRLSYLVDAATGVLAFVIVFFSASWASDHMLHDSTLARTSNCMLLRY